MHTPITLAAFKLDGAGNRFVAVDWRAFEPLHPRSAAEVAPVLCAPPGEPPFHGLLLIERPREGYAHFRMRYVNADGSPAAYCGNGARCIARLAVDLGIAPNRMTFETDAGLTRADVDTDMVSVSMPDPKTLFRTGLPLADAAESVDFINTGVPHAIAWVGDIAATDVNREGRRIRRDSVFGIEGANVNFARPIDNSAIRIRTYERGVEAETPACGTGAVAAAIAHAIRQDSHGERVIGVIPSSGTPLFVSFRVERTRATDVILAGPAEIHGVTPVDLHIDSPLAEELIDVT